jgi:hypothetical protein
VRKLFLDDMRKAPDFTWDVARCFDDFVKYITLHGVPDVISFDHDLADQHYASEDQYGRPIPYNEYTEKTGYDCAKWLIERGELPKNYIVHSLNPVGAQNIKFVMNAAYRRWKEGI